MFYLFTGKHVRIVRQIIEFIRNRVERNSIRDVDDSADCEVIRLDVVW